MLLATILCKTLLCWQIFLAAFKDSVITKSSSYLIIYCSVWQWTANQPCWLTHKHEKAHYLYCLATWGHVIPDSPEILLRVMFGLAQVFSTLKNLRNRYCSQINGRWNSRNHCSWKRGIFTELRQQLTLERRCLKG